MSDIVVIKVDENSSQTAKDFATEAAAAALEAQLAKPIETITPADVPDGIGVRSWNAVEPGVYPNCGGITIPENCFAIIKRDAAGAFSFTKTDIELGSYAKKSLLDFKADLFVGKNKFNKNDTSIITPAYFENSSGGIQTGIPSTGITHYIAIKAGQTLFSMQMWGGSGVQHELTDINRLNPVFIPANPARTVTATIDGFVRISLATNNFNIVLIEEGVSGTSYEEYYTYVNKDFIKDLNESAIPLLTDYSKFIAGKNKFNYEDVSVITPGYFENSSGYIQAAIPGTAISHYMPVKAGQVLHCLRFWNDSGVHHEFTDINKLNPIYILGATTEILTVPMDGFLRCSLNLGGQPISRIQVEEGNSATQFEDYKYGVERASLLPKKNNTITVNRFGTSGVDADFCGLNAIGDALASITDASEDNRYVIRVDGIFYFTNPAEFVYKFIPFDEPTIVVSKKYVDIEGYGIDRTILSVDLAVGSSFPAGKSHMDYQPVMLTTTSKISNLSIIAKNCRYAIHSDAVDDDSVSEVENCEIIHKGNSTINGGIPDGTTLGTGVGNNSIWTYKNCKIKSVESALLGIHSGMGESVKNGAYLHFENCFLSGIIAPNYIANDVPISIDFLKCKYAELTSIVSTSMPWTNMNKLADYSLIKITADEPLLFSNNTLKGKGLRIKSKTSGLSSTITFDNSSTAFNLIIGNNQEVNEAERYSFKKQFGYFYKTGGVGLNAVIISNLDIDETGINSLGKRLGNCSVVNKTLTVIIDGTSYNVVFNENFTAQNNTYVISKITAVIGTIADVDSYAIGQEYYPLFNNVQEMKNIDSTAIKAGMGVVFLSVNTMRIALNIDNRVDAICLDDVAPNAYGRMQRGKIFSSASAQRFSTLEVNTNTASYGDEFGISTTQPGYFDKTASPKFLRAFDTNTLNFK